MTDTSQTPSINPAAIRSKRLILFGSGLCITALVWTAYIRLSDNNSQSTDDAYVNGHIVAVTPQVAGTVIRVGADNSDRVPAGTLLAEIDSADARVELSAAEANLARAVRNVRGLFATDARFSAEIRAAMANLDKARADFQQRQSIADTGAISAEDVRHAHDALLNAEASLSAAREARAQALAQISGVTLASHPEVQSAAERVRTAALTLARTHIIAPVGGMIARRSVQLGQRVAAGDKLMAVVPLDNLWVDANFKEVQLDGICPGQPASITADIYGDRLVYHGKVVNVEAGSGAAFATLPAQNATGNWIKVVQRVPVRIQLDPTELSQHPLRIGLSVKVTVDTGRCDETARTTTPQSEEISLFSAQLGEADATVARVIATSIGGQP